MISNSPTVLSYLASLPDDRRSAIGSLRDVINARLPAGYVEGMQFGMISWFIPLSRYPDTYNGHALAVASLASQKNHMALYLMGVYGDPALRSWFTSAYKASGKRLDMGKACVRFKTLEALPLEVIGETIARVPVETYLASYEKARPAKARAKPSSKSRVKISAKAKPTAKIIPKPKARPTAKIAAKPKRR